MFPICYWSLAHCFTTELLDKRNGCRACVAIFVLRARSKMSKNGKSYYTHSPYANTWEIFKRKSHLFLFSLPPSFNRCTTLSLIRTYLYVVYFKVYFIHALFPLPISFRLSSHPTPFWFDYRWLSFSHYFLHIVQHFDSCIVVSVFYLFFFVLSIRFDCQTEEKKILYLSDFLLASRNRLFLFWYRLVSDLFFFLILILVVVQFASNVLFYLQ